MTINVEIKIVNFGQIGMDVGRSVPKSEEAETTQLQETVRYQEPQETASRMQKLAYGEEPTGYVVPLSTA